MSDLVVLSFEIIDGAKNAPDASNLFIGLGNGGGGAGSLRGYRGRVLGVKLKQAA